MRRTKKFALLLIGCAALLLTGSSFAYWSGQIEHTNRLQADRMQAVIQEEFVQGSKPSGTVAKKVSFQNASSNAAFLRVCYAETWQKTEAGEEMLLNNQVNGTEVAAKHWLDGFAGTGGAWWNGNDGWFYYRKILKPGESTANILESVSFPTYSGAFAEYADASYQLYFRMELLQASDSAFTLNSAEVNANASAAVFGRTAVINADGSSVSWQ